MRKVEIERTLNQETGEIMETRIVRRGRPPKKAGDTIYKRITINCNKEEYEAIEAKCESLGELAPGIQYNVTMLTKIAIMQYLKP